MVFMHAWAKRAGVRLVADSALPWLLGIAANVLRNDRRSARRRDHALARLPGSEHTEDPAERVAERVDAERRLASAARAISALGPDEREVAQLVWWSGLSYDEAAVALNIPIGTVRSRLSRARARIQNAVSQAVLATASTDPTTSTNSATSTNSTEENT